MRIISGLFKGKKILEPKDSETRPLKDLTKESIFNIIIHSNKLGINLKNASVLDLFSGVGSFGIECLSREVKNVTFVENYKNVLPILKRNLFNLKSINNYKIFETDVFKDELIFKTDHKFDIIFLDPPYKYRDLSHIFLEIKKNKILNNNGIIVLHRHKNNKDIYPSCFEVVEEKKYGVSKIIFISELN